MAIKTFTSGEVLTASDTNTYLANSGLTYITRGTVTSPTAGLVINGCFTSTYDNYRVVISRINLNPNPCSLFFRMRAGGSDYSAAFNYWAYNGIQANSTVFNSNALNDTSLFTGVVSTYNDAMGNVSMDIYSPQTASVRTYATVQTVGYNGNFYTRNGIVVCDNTTQFDGLSFFTDNAGTPINELTVTVFGYRKP
jgi:hypothetical protein